MESALQSTISSWGDFDFITPNLLEFDAADSVNENDKEIAYVPKLFSDEEVEELMLWFLFRARMAQYFQIRRSRKPGYDFSAYSEEVQRSIPLWYSLKKRSATLGCRPGKFYIFSLSS